MKKANPDFKILTKQKTKNVKGGGWFSDLMTLWYNRRTIEETPCPPPEPDTE